MGFPTIRPRRLRATPELRALVRETTLSPGDFVLPLFFNATLDAPRPVGTMPGVDQLPVGAAASQARSIKERGIGSVILFGLPKTKDARGSSGLDPDGPVPRAIAEMKAAVPEAVVMADVCVDEYTDHGHCGVLTKAPSGKVIVDNDATVEILAEMAVVFARAGADVVAPSDMMDGRVAALRRSLDANGYTDVSLLSYAVKYASAFYGPFREAADCAPKFGDRAGYQMDPGNAREALREAALDEAEGADMLMVKPALSYLDVIRDVRRASNLPLGAYNVSGEYAMLHAAADRGMIDRDRAILEVLTSIRRAGADFILTYHALRAAELPRVKLRLVAFAAVWLTTSAVALLAPGCYGRNCEGILQTYGTDAGQGRMLSPDIWESSPVDGKWLWFPRQHYFVFDISELGGRTPQVIIPYVSAQEEPRLGGNFTVGAGNMALISNSVPNRVDVRNDTCSDTFLRLVVVTGPQPPGVPDAAAPVEVEEPDAASDLDAGADADASP